MTAAATAGILLADTAPERPLRAGHLAYRRDIDGLRALAVVPVVLEHARMRGFHGGFVGVDIFFVISGFLITTLLIEDIAGGQYAIGAFYRRRVLRIMPALLAMLAVTALGVALFLLPSDGVDFAHSLAATSVFGSNVLFWTQHGYFDRASLEKPLLHTWSLAIEEQFYILWPLALAAIGNRQRALTALCAGVTAISFALSVIMLRTAPAAAFYLLPARAWELGVGAMLAIVPMPVLGRKTANVLGLAALGAIVVAIKIYTSQTPFPGPAALVPCLGAALLIATGDPRQPPTATRALLAHPVLTWIGRISYSLYLWHWPVIVFSSLVLLIAPTTLAGLCQLGLSIALADLSQRFVEAPFRRKHAAFTTRRVLCAALLAILACLAVATAMALAIPRFNRLTEPQRALAAYAAIDSEPIYRGGTCFQVGDAPGGRGAFQPDRCLAVRRPGLPVVMIMGDSHAAHLWPGFSTMQDRMNVLQATRTGCKPVLVASPRNDCERFFAEMIARLPALHPDYLLIAARWDAIDGPDLAQTLRDPRVKAAHAVVIGPVPRYLTDLPRLLVAADRAHDPALPFRHYEPGSAQVDPAISAAASMGQTRYVSLIALLCPRYPVCRTMADSKEPMQFDYGHLTIGGSRVVTEGIARQLRLQ